MKYIIPFIFLFVIACQQKDLSSEDSRITTLDSIRISLKVLNKQVLADVPSASGVAKWNNAYWCIGDDSPFLFKLDSQLQTLDTIAIFGTEQMVESRLDRCIKPDFEAMEPVSDKELLVLASGSFSPQRDLGVHIAFNEEVIVHTYQLTPFYDYLRNDSLLFGKELNLEGLAMAHGNLYLFNRGQNLIFQIVKNDFIQYLNGEKELPVYQVHKYTLPKLDSLEAGFSGASYCPEWDALLFTASYEAAPNAYCDGTIGGSLVGLILMNDSVLGNDYAYTMLPTEEPLKIESIAIDSVISAKEIQVIMVSDSDGGDSHYVKALMSIE